MKIVSKQMILPLAAVAIIGATAYGVTAVSAASDAANPRATLIQKLADTFHLDKSKVQAVFDQNRADNQAARESNYEAKLNQAVTDGKLTATQKDLVLAEHKKLAEQMQAAMDGNAADHRTAMDKVRDESKTWAAQNNIDAKWLMGAGGHGRGGMMRGSMMNHMEEGDADDAAPAPTPSPGA